MVVELGTQCHIPYCSENVFAKIPARDINAKITGFIPQIMIAGTTLLPYAIFSSLPSGHHFYNTTHLLCLLQQFTSTPRFCGLLPVLFPEHCSLFLQDLASLTEKIVACVCLLFHHVSSVCNYCIRHKIIPLCILKRYYIRL